MGSRHLSSFLLWVPLAGTFFSSCIFQGESAKTRHVAGQLVASDNPIQWQEHPPEFIRSWLREKPEDVVPRDALATRRVQGWLDALDAAIRQRHPEQFKNVPKPVAVVLKKAEVNGFSFAVPLCFQVKVKLPPPPPRSPTSYLMGVDFNHNEGKVEAAQSAVCLRRETDLGLLKAHIDLYNAQVKNERGCRMVLEGGTVSFQGECGFIPGGVESDLLRLRAMSTSILVTTGLLAAFSEEEFVAAMGHELGHYYRAHSLAAPESSAFYYRHEAGDTSGKPTPSADPALASLGGSLRRLGAIPYYEPIPPPSPGISVPQTPLHRTVLAYMLLNPVPTSMMKIPFIDQMAGTCGRIEKCIAACRPLAELLPKSDATPPPGQPTPTKIQLSGLTAPSPLSQEQIDDYWKLQSAVLSCASELRLEGRGRPGSLETDFLERVLPAALVERGPAPVAAGGPGTGDASSLRSRMERYSLSVSQAEAEYVRLGRQAEEARLGFYTSEQEADDISLELLSAMGFDPAVGVGMMLKALKEYSAPVDPGQWPFEKCAAAQASGWMSGGQPLVAPVGDWSAYHHSSCYRVYNMAREIRSHRYTVDAAARPRFAEPWSEVQREASGGSSPAPGTGEALFERMERLKLCASGYVHCGF